VVSIYFMYSNVDCSCYRISQDLAVKLRGSHRILQENTGNIWNMEAVFPPGIFRTFTMISGRILSESTRICRNPPKKNPENCQPEYCFQLPSIFRCIPAVSSHTPFTWVIRNYLMKNLNLLFVEQCMHQYQLFVWQAYKNSIYLLPLTRRVIEMYLHS